MSMTPEKLTAWREAHGLSRPALAKLLDCSPQTIFAWESGRRNMPAVIIGLALSELNRRLRKNK